jgi:hypothetical protein
MAENKNEEFPFPILAIGALIGFALGLAGGCVGGTSDERTRANDTFCKPICGKADARIDVVNLKFQCFCEVPK